MTIAIVSGPTTAAGTSVVLTGVPVGSSIIIGVFSQGGGTITSITCTGESNLTIHGSPTAHDSYTYIRCASLANVTTAGTKTLQVNGASNQLIAFAVSGADTSSFFDAVQYATASNANPTVNVTAARANSLLFGLVGTPAPQCTVGAGFTFVDVPDGNLNQCAEYNLDAGAAGAKQVFFTRSASGAWGAMGAVFNAAPPPAAFALASPLVDSGVVAAATAGVTVSANTGELVVIDCWWTGSSFTSLVTSSGETVSLGTEQNDNNGPTMRLRKGYFKATSSGARTITFAATGASDRRVCARAFVATGNIVYVGENNNTAVSTDPTTAITATANNLLVSYCVTSDTSVEPVEDTAGAFVGEATTEPAGKPKQHGEYKLDAGSVGSKTVKFTLANSRWVVTTMAFESAAPPSPMAHALRAGPVQTPQSAVNGNTVVITLPGTAAGENLLVGAYWLSDVITITGVTCSGESPLTLLIGQHHTSTNQRAQLAYLSELTSGGTKTITITFSQILTFHRGGVAATFANGRKTGWFDAQAGTTGGTADASVAVSTSVTGGLVAAMVYSYGSTEIIPGAGYTGFSVTESYQTALFEYDLDAGPAGSKTVNFAFPATNWALAAAAFQVDPYASMTGTAAGTGTAAAVGVGYSISVGAAAGTSTAQGAAAGTQPAVGTASGAGTATGVAAAVIQAATGSAGGISIVNGAGFAGVISERNLLQAATGYGVGSVTLTLNSTAAGNSLVLFAYWRDHSATISGISCTGESGFTVRGSVIKEFNQTFDIQGADRLNLTSGGSKVVTVTMSAGINVFAVVMEFVGFHYSNAFVAAAGAPGSNVANPTVDITAVDTGILVGAAFSSHDELPGTGFVDVPFYDASPSNQVGSAQYKLNAGPAGTKTFSFISQGVPAQQADDDWVIVAHSYAPAPPPNIGMATGVGVAQAVSTSSVVSVGNALGTGFGMAIAGGPQPAVGEATGTFEVLGSTSNFSEGFGTAAGVGAAAAMGSFFDINVYGNLRATLTRMRAKITARESDNLHARFPRMSTTMSGRIVPVGTINARLPLMSMHATGGLDALRARLPAMRAALAGHPGVGATLRAALFRPNARLTGSSPYVGRLAVRMLPMRTLLIAHQVPIATIVARMPRMRAVLSARGGAVASLTARMPRMRATLSAYSDSHGVLTARLPRLFARMLGYQSKVPSGVGEEERALTLVLGTTNMALTEYAQYPFNSFTEFGGLYYAANENGIFQIDTGDDDHGVDISARFSTAQLDFASEFLKRMTDAYAGMRANGQLLVRVTVDENGEYATYDYLLDPLDIATLRQRRVPIGKGLRGKYWQFEFKNVEGSDFEIDTLNLAAVVVARRI